MCSFPSKSASFGTISPSFSVSAASYTASAFIILSFATAGRQVSIPRRASAASKARMSRTNLSSGRRRPGIEQMKAYFPEKSASRAISSGHSLASPSITPSGAGLAICAGMCSSTPVRP